LAAPRVARQGEETAELQSAPFATRDTPPLKPHQGALFWIPGFLRKHVPSPLSSDTGPGLEPGGYERPDADRRNIRKITFRLQLR
jgi:hypothetical protein